MHACKSVRMCAFLCVCLHVHACRSAYMRRCVCVCVCVCVCARARAVIVTVTMSELFNEIYQSFRTTRDIDPMRTERVCVCVCLCVLESITGA